jgi:endonuclease/exonuclease/phosphatase family metal-dependent hydrolase
MRFGTVKSTSTGLPGLLVLLALLLISAPASAADPFRVATFNIHYITDPDGLPKWEARRGAVTAVLKEMDADIIGFQEMETFAGSKFNPVNRQRDWILKTVPGYLVAAIGDPAKFPSTQPVFYRKDRFEVLDHGWFFYSETPDVIYSRSFDGGFDYYTVTAQFRDRQSGQTLTVFNVHTDIRSISNRKRAIEMIAARAQKLVNAGEPVLVFGDFNALWFGSNMKRLESAGLAGTRLARPTFHFGIGAGVTPAIDHILHAPGLSRISEATIHKTRANGAYPSDHFPVSALYRFEWWLAHVSCVEIHAICPVFPTNRFA